MQKRVIANIIFMACLLAEAIFAQNSLVDSSYGQIGIAGNLPGFLPAAKARMTFPLSWLSGSFSDFEAWRIEARAIVHQAFMAEPPLVPFSPQIIDREDRGTYIAKKIMLNISGDSRVPGYLLIPKGDGPFPAVLLLHDHGAKFDIGKEKVVRPFHDKSERIESAEAWKDKIYGGRFIGDELAARGYVCLTVDALNWGDRSGAGYEGQQALASNLLNLGMSYAGLIAWEDINAARFLATLPEVDPQRIAAVGLSMGAWRAWQIAAMSDDIRAAVCICRMASTKELMVDGNNLTRGQSAFTTTHPGLINYLDVPDVAAIACPKSMLFYNGENDHLLPVAAVNEAFEKMQAVWASQNARDKLVTQFWPVKHEFSLAMQEEAFQWLDSQMQNTKKQDR